MAGIGKYCEFTRMGRKFLERKKVGVFLVRDEKFQLTKNMKFHLKPTGNKRNNNEDKSIGIALLPRSCSGLCRHFISCKRGHGWPHERQRRRRRRRRGRIDGWYNHWKRYGCFFGCCTCTAETDECSNKPYKPKHDGCSSKLRSKSRFRSFEKTTRCFFKLHLKPTIRNTPYLDRFPSPFAPRSTSPSSSSDQTLYAQLDMPRCRLEVNPAQLALLRLTCGIDPFPYFS